MAIEIEKDINAQPAGTLPLEDPGQEETPVVDPALPATTLDPEPDGEIPEKFKGKSVADVAASYEKLAALSGKQSNELGDLRTQNRELVQNQMKLQEQITQVQSPEARQDFQEQIADIAQKMEDGEVTARDGSIAIAQLSIQVATEQATKSARQDYAALRKDDKEQGDFAGFKKENPEFVQLRDSGELDKFITNAFEVNENGQPDYLLLYHKRAATLAKGAVKEAGEAGIVQGQKEVASIKEGTEVTTKVLTKPGGEIRQTTPQKKTLEGQELVNDIMGHVFPKQGAG